ncbi:hypothetical protein CK203_082556 [Vitis vinifera]|uniref:Uncharacterized protein n=1 Tax=Vitis vinifera TaxID=29760 RepID=A0A438DJX9_VITVI|nr:hypothetical protein CK203_082556 [Vitis vinifera]
MGDIEKLHAKLERVKNDLADAQKAVMDRAEALGKAEGEKKTAQAEVGRLREDVKDDYLHFIGKSERGVSNSHLEVVP